MGDLYLGVLHGVDAFGSQPVVKPHGVGAGGKGLRKGVFALFGSHQLGQTGTVDGALVSQLL